MRVAVLAESLPVLGGAEKHGLLLLGPLLGLHDVTVFYRAARDLDVRAVEERYGFPLEGVRLRRYDAPGAASRLTRGHDLCVNISTTRLIRNRAARGVLLVFFPFPLDDRPGRPATLGHAVQRRQEALREWLDWVAPDVQAEPFGRYLRTRGGLAALGRLPLFGLRKLSWLGGLDDCLGRDVVASYDVLLANSAFTADWTERVYGRPARVNYPPIDTARFRPAAKLPVVLSVGRFDPEPNSKKHHVLVEAFKRLYDAHVLRGWRLWVCGSTDGREGERQYLEALRRAAAGYPISFGVNLAVEELAGLYGEASLYWHARGHGEDPGAHPWRFEHFGMTTVEAMAAGCVPMVLAAGGQAEIVRPGRDGFCWASPDELEQQVRRFLGLGDARVEALRAAARARAEDYNHASFYRRACDLYASLGVAHRAAPGGLRSERSPEPVAV